MNTPADSEVHQQILDLIKTIPMFERLADEEIQRIYGICTLKRYGDNELMYEFGTPSDDLFILMDGRLVARTPTDVDIAHITPIGVVGEMGLIMDQPRSANVVALEDSMGFQISKRDLICLFLADGAICRKVLLNLVKILSTKLYATNAEIQRLREEQTQAVTANDQSDNIFLY